MAQEVEINLFDELNKNLYFNIVQVGCGGNGGYLVQHLAQMMNVFNLRGEYLIADPDLVESKNLANQLFLEKDVGKSKAEVLAKRYKRAYQVNISSFDLAFIEKEELLERFLSETSFNKKFSSSFPILIGCVDNHFSRQLFHKVFEKCPNLLYIDAGITSAAIPRGKSVSNLSDWSDDEIATFNRTGYTGQIVAGLRLRGETILEPAGGLFPDILEDEDIAPSQAACSSLVASDPQRLITNRTAAMVMGMYLNNLFSSGTLNTHYTVFHSKKNHIRSQPITI